MFEDYDPREGRVLSLLNEEGDLASIPAGLPRLADDQALAAYKTMVLSRQVDEWAFNLNRQGRVPTYPPNKGQEANSAGALLAVRKDDWIVPTFRELAGLLIRGVSLKAWYLYWYGNEWASHLSPDEFHVLPISVPVGSQLLHGVGVSWAERYRGSDRISVVFSGEGGTSEGEFHEACNLAGVWKTGTIFYVQNNYWSISVPWPKQSASATAAEKGFAYGFPGIRVDGNDVFAVYAAVKTAADRARSGQGPALIEGLTYRMGAHTTSDDPTRYRKEEEVKKWEHRDPITRLERYLVRAGKLTPEEPEKLREQSLDCAKSAFEEAEQLPDPPLEETFRYHFIEMPDLLQRQLERRKP